MSLPPARVHQLIPQTIDHHPRHRVFRAGVLAAVIGFGATAVLFQQEHVLDERTSAIIEIMAVGALLGGFFSETILNRLKKQPSPLMSGVYAALLAFFTSLILMSLLNGLIFLGSDFRDHAPLTSWMGLKQFSFTVLFGAGYFALFGLRLLLPYAIFGYIAFGVLISLR